LSISNVYTASPATGGGGLPAPVGSDSTTVLGFDDGRVTEDWTITPALLNQFRIGFNRQTQVQDSPQRLNGWPQQLGLTGMQFAAGAFPNISWGSFTSTGVTLGYNNRVSNSYILSDALSWTHGRHSFKFGGEIRDVNTYKKLQNWASLTFSRNETALPTALSTTGLEFASFLLGQVDQAGQSLYGSPLPHETTWQIGIYAQDDFKISQRVTINYGLRLDIYTPVGESHGFYGIMDPAIPNPDAGNLPGTYIFGHQNGYGNSLPPAINNTYNFGPRIGIAWKAGQKTAVRLGYGISYFATGAFGGGNNTNLADGYWVTSAVASLNSGLTPAYTFAQGFPAANLTIPPFLSPALGLSGQVVNFFDTSADRAAYAQN
jgi:TonB dependent receptor